MASPSTVGQEPTQTPSSRQIAESGANLADLLAAAGNGIRITGLVLVAEAPREIKGTSGKGNSYAFAVREIQMFTGNKAVQCKQQLDIGQQFPEVLPGTVRTFKIKSVRMNGNIPVFELETAE